MQRSKNSLTEVINARVLNPIAKLGDLHRTKLAGEKQEGPVLVGHCWVENALHACSSPHERNLPLNESVDNRGRGLGINRVEDSYELSHYPLGHVKDNGGIHSIRIHVAA